MATAARSNTPSGRHDRFVKLVEGLGSECVGERDAAARTIERLRRRTGETWGKLLRPGRASS